MKYLSTRPKKYPASDPLLNPRKAGTGIALIISALLAFPLPALASFLTGYSADVMITVGGQTQTGTAKILSDQYRIILNNDSRPITWQISLKPGRSYLLFPKNKKFVPVDIDNPRLITMDPLLEYHSLSHPEAPLKQTTETINDEPCGIQILPTSANPKIKAWYAPRIGFPVKIIRLTGDKRTIVFQNIRPDRFTPDSLGIPADYSEAIITSNNTAQMFSIDAASQGKTGHISDTPPCAVPLEPGATLTVSVDPAREVTIWAASKSQKVSGVTAEPFFKGERQPLVGIKMAEVKGERSHKVLVYNNDAPMKDRFLVDELVISCQRQPAWVYVEQSGPIRQDLIYPGGFRRWRTSSI